MKKTLTLSVNGKAVECEVDCRMTLAEFLREELRLTGTKVGCNRGECGACTVILDGKTVYSCSILALEAEGGHVFTIESLAEGEKLHPLQNAFLEHDGLQCGFCTPGMIMTGVALAQENAKPSEREIREYLEGNFCRCTGYHNIVKAIEAGAKAMGK